MTREFAEIQVDLRHDGALRDFYVQGTAATDWTLFLRRITACHPTASFTVDGASRQLPDAFDAIEEIRAHGSPCLSIPIAGSSVNCHFFSRNEIELDFRPEDYSTPEHWSRLSHFLQGVVDLIGKPGIVTHENARECIIEAFQPCKKVEPQRRPNRSKSRGRSR